jgi:predicted GNAT family N-acyltransferase
VKKEIRVFKHGSADYVKALALRYRILRKPLNLQFTPEEIKKDEEDLHFGLFQRDRILACLTLSKTENNRMKMRQVAVDDEFQNLGLGKELSKAAERYAKENGYCLMFCNARKVAVPFYKKMGYEIVSDEFTEVNIPHYTMQKAL